STYHRFTFCKLRTFLTMVDCLSRFTSTISNLFDIIWHLGVRHQVAAIPSLLTGGSMCDTADDGVGISNSVPAELKLRNRGLRTADISELMPFARQLVNSRENRDSH